MHIQRAEKVLSGYCVTDWHLIEPSDAEYLEAAQVFLNHQVKIGRLIQSIEVKEFNYKNSIDFQESWCDSIDAVFGERVWAAKQILDKKYKSL